MPDFYRTAQLSDQEQATLADAVNGTNIEHLLAALRRTFNKHTRTTLTTLAKTGTMTADTASDACHELDERIELLSHLPDLPETAKLLDTHRQAHDILSAATTELNEQK